MSDLILMHGENGKTFFVDKDEYLAHWEWTKPTKYIDKYEKNGKTVYVYDDKSKSPTVNSYYDQRRGKTINFVTGSRNTDKIEKTKNGYIGIKNDKEYGSSIQKLSNIPKSSVTTEKEITLSDGSKAILLDTKQSIAPIVNRVHSRDKKVGIGTAKLKTTAEREAEAEKERQDMQAVADALDLVKQKQNETNLEKEATKKAEKEREERDFKAVSDALDMVKKEQDSRKEKEVTDKEKEAKIRSMNEKTRKRALRDAKSVAETEGISRAESVADQVVQSLGLNLGDDRKYTNEYKETIIENLKDRYIDEAYEELKDYINTKADLANSNGDVYEWELD